MKRILLDQNIPTKLARALVLHHVETVYRRGWSTLGNGRLIAAAEAAGFDVMVTADQNIEHQQNLSGRRLAILVLDTNRWLAMHPHIDTITAAVSTIAAGCLLKVHCF